MLENPWLSRISKYIQNRVLSDYEHELFHSSCCSMYSASFSCHPSVRFGTFVRSSVFVVSLTTAMCIVGAANYLHFQ